MTPARPEAQGAAQVQSQQGSNHEQSLRQLGVSQEAIERNRRPGQAAEAFVPWAWHVDAMRLFGGMRTQWNVQAAVGGLIYTGLNYAALATVKAELGLADRGQELFDQLQAIERGALDYLNSRFATPTTT